MYVPNIHLSLPALSNMINKHDNYETAIFFESISLFFVNHGIICCKQKQMFDRTQVIQEKIFFLILYFFSFHVQNVFFFFLSLGCFILQLMLIFSLFSFFVFSFNICLIHKEKHAFFHFFHSVFCIFSGLLFIFFLLVLGYQG